MITRKRDVDQVKQLQSIFPVTALLGARQTGKTTLAKQLDAQHYFDPFWMKIWAQFFVRLSPTILVKVYGVYGVGYRDVPEEIPGAWAPPGGDWWSLKIQSAQPLQFFVQIDFLTHPRRILYGSAIPNSSIVKYLSELGIDQHRLIVPIEIYSRDPNPKSQLFKNLV